MFPKCFLSSIYALDLLFARRYDEVVLAAREALRMQPGSRAAASALLSACRMKGSPQERLAAAKMYYAAYETPGVDLEFDRGYSEGSYRGAVRRAADTLAARVGKTYLAPSDVADLYLDASDKSQALAWLEKGVDVRDPNMPYIGVYPNYSVLHSDPRFQDLLRRIGLPQN